MPRTLPIVILAIAALSHAQVPDHLKCYKVKDPSPRTDYTADLGGLAPEPGCVIKTPAKMLCVQSTKDNVNPPPSGAPAGGPAGRFVCYVVKCPKAGLAPVTIADQFGTRDLQPIKAKLLCAPAGVPTTTSTSTTITTTTSQTSTSSTTTTLIKAQGEPCGAAAECATGFCVDGYCCDTACTSSCMACDNPGALGACSDVPFQDPPRHGTCPACSLCTGTGTCCTTLQCTFPNGACVQ